MHTYDSALALIGVTVPDHLDAGAEVPVLTGPQAQGDLLVTPEEVPDDDAARRRGKPAAWVAVPAQGVQVVHGEATGNTHWLHAGFDSPGVRWRRVGDGGLVLGYVQVPAGQSALLIHTDEHGANGIGPGTYAIRGKRELGLAVRAVERRVMD
jgi:hypothetical protein